MIGRRVTHLRLSSMRLPSFAENNKYYFALLAALPAAAGSTVSVLLVVSDIWALISLALGRFRLRYLPTDGWVVVPAVLYTAVMVASIVVRLNGPADLGLAMTPAMYLTIPLLIARCRATPEVDYFGQFVRAAPFCGILLLPVMVWQISTGGDRITGFAGNPFPFAMICAVLGPVALFNLPRASRMLGVLALVGFASCAAGVLLSVTRSVWIVMILNLLVVLWALGGWCVVKRHWITFAAMVCVLAGIAVAFSGRVEGRVGMLVDDFHAIAENRVPHRSLAIRMGLWSGGLKAVGQRPVFGYGANNRSRIIRQIPIEFPASRDRPRRVGHVTVSNFHNGFLTAMIDAGIFGVLVTAMLLFAPLALAVFAPRDDIYRLRLAFALLVFFTYAISGSVNIMFGQDLIDALFVTGCLVLALSVGTGPRAAMDGGGLSP